MSGGACFSPRLNPRPKPLRTVDVLRRAIIEHIHFPILTATVYNLLFPAYMAVVAYWKNYQLSNRSFLVGIIVVIIRAVWVYVYGRGDQEGEKENFSLVTSQPACYDMIFAI